MILLSGCKGSHIPHATETFPEQTGFVQLPVKYDGGSRNVWVFIPADYQPGKLYPAILFLHGLFEGGNGGTTVLSAGLGPIVARSAGTWPFITIFPQSSGTWKGVEREQLALAALEEAQKHYSIDADRIILAGLSYGGLGVWEIGARNPGKFAALVPVSALGTPDQLQVATAVPVWTFASRNDPWVRSENSVEMFQAIEANGGRVRITRFDGDDHDCWAQAVEQSELLPWMLRQRRNPLQTTVHSLSTGPQSPGRLRGWNER